MERLDKKDWRFILGCVLAIGAGSAVTAALFPRAFPEAAMGWGVASEGGE